MTGGCPDGLADWRARHTFVAQCKGQQVEAPPDSRAEGRTAGFRLHVCKTAASPSGGAVGFTALPVALEHNQERFDPMFAASAQSLLEQTVMQRGRMRFHICEHVRP